jgi:hypothetical protein
MSLKIVVLTLGCFAMAASQLPTCYDYCGEDDDPTRCACYYACSGHYQVCTCDEGAVAAMRSLASKTMAAMARRSELRNLTDLPSCDGGDGYCMSVCEQRTTEQSLAQCLIDCVCAGGCAGPNAHCSC